MALAGSNIAKVNVGARGAQTMEVSQPAVATRDLRHITRAELDRLYLEQVLPLFHDQGFVSELEQTALDEKTVFYLDMLRKGGIDSTDRHLVDLGSGLSPYPLVFRRVGFRVSIVDDFGGGGFYDKEHERESEALLDRFRDAGVEIHTQDVLKTKLPMPDESVDVITTFHCIEHWHDSPRALFGEIRRVLKPGGLLMIGCPNAVNLRKRISVFFGESNLPPLEGWYYDGEPFRGHVREPIVSDLRRLMEWNGLETLLVEGR